MKIKYLPYQPHCFAFGGFEIQMLSTFNEIKKLGINIEKLNVWDRNADFDILHCWGLGLANYENVYWGKKAKKKVIVTTLHSYYEENIDKLKYYLSSVFYKQRLHQEMLKNIDTIVVVNEQQAEICYKYFKIPEYKVKIIPNIIDEKFFDYREKSLIPEKNKGYILCVGNVCKRKNQVNLTQSCVEAKIPLILIGKTLDGEDKYAEKLNDIIVQNSNIQWIKGLPENSDTLLDYFANSLAVALPSFTEQQPISLLEAAVLNKPLIIADKAYAKQKYYSNSQLVDPNSINSIMIGLNSVVKNPSKYYPDFKVLLDCKGINVANSYLKIYQNVLA